MSKPWWKSKTLWFNGLVAVGVALEANLGILNGHISTNAYMALAVLVPGVNIMLRTITSEGLTK
jgi:hypothetical protein